MGELKNVITLSKHVHPEIAEKQCKQTLVVV